jgi:excinuclease UvrABC nuclease subunit
MGAVGAGLSIASSLAGIGQQSKAASAQKRAIASQQRQQELQSQLQYLSIKNQDASDTLTESINRQVQQLAYTQSQNNLTSQQNLNNLAVQQALFDSTITKANADITRTQTGLDVDRSVTEGNQAVGQQELQAIVQAAQANGTDLNAILQGLSRDGEQSSAIANLLDLAASSGGINEAISLLTGGDVNAATNATAAIGRSGEVSTARQGNASEVSQASKQVNTSAGTGALKVADIAQSQAIFNADASELDARTSQQVANAGFDVTQAANEAAFRTGIIADDSASFSRRYLTAANLEALDKGASLQADISNAQRAQVRTPGFLDYAGVAVSGFNTVNSLRGK